jgi:hypothetical protein
MALPQGGGRLPGHPHQTPRAHRPLRRGPGVHHPGGRSGPHRGRTAGRGQPQAGQETAASHGQPGILGGPAADRQLHPAPHPRRREGHGPRPQRTARRRRQRVLPGGPHGRGHGLRGPAGRGRRHHGGGRGQHRDGGNAFGRWRFRTVPLRPAERHRPADQPAERGGRIRPGRHGRGHGHPAPPGRGPRFPAAPFRLGRQPAARRRGAPRRRCWKATSSAWPAPTSTRPTVSRS